MSSEIQNLKQRGDIKGIVDVLNDANQRIHLRSIEVSQGRFDDVNGYDDYVFVRLEAVRALEEIGDDDAIRALQQILEIKRTLGYESLKTDVAKAIKAIQHRKPEVPAKGDMTVKQLYITKEQQKYGPYSVDEVRQYIADKHFTTSDWAWHEGLTDWVPIHSIPGVVTQNAPPLLPVQSPNDGKAQPLLAKDNKGTRFRDKSHADSHWNARYLTRFTPVVIYNFPTLEAARKAITSLSFIREASDTGELVATEVVEFGCFLRGDQGEVSICGDMFTREMWREAKDKLTAAGGKAYCEKEPKEDAGKTKQSTDADPSLVKFVREERQGPNTYRMHRGPNKSSAMAFLQAHSVERRLYYIVVETPEGNLGRDFDGIYNE